MFKFSFQKEANAPFNTIEDSGINIKFVNIVYDALLHTVSKKLSIVRTDWSSLIIELHSKPLCSVCCFEFGFNKIGLIWLICSLRTHRNQSWRELLIAY